MADVSGPRSGAPSVDSRDNELDELVSLGSIGVGTNCSDSLFGAVVSTPNSNLSVVAGDNPPNSDLIVANVNESSDNVLNIVNSKESSNIDKVDINDNVYKTSSEGLLSEEASSDNDSDNEKEFSENVIHSDNESSANMQVEAKTAAPSVNIVSPGSSLCGLSVSSGGRPSLSKLPVTVSSKIPKAPEAGIRKTASSRPGGLTPGLHKAALDLGVLSKRRK